jgi:hypothetical protein
MLHYPYSLILWLLRFSIIYKTSVHNSQKTQHVCITNAVQGNNRSLWGESVKYINTPFWPNLEPSTLNLAVHIKKLGFRELTAPLNIAKSVLLFNTACVIAHSYAAVFKLVISGTPVAKSEFMRNLCNTACGVRRNTVWIRFIQRIRKHPQIGTEDVPTASCDRDFTSNKPRYFCRLV